MNIDSIQNGYVIDHINAGKAMELYNLLDLSKGDFQVAIINNASSKKYGKKDIIKIDALIPLDFNLIAYLSPNATVSIIKDGVLIEKKALEMPEKLVNIIKCKNSRCITSTEQEIDQVFVLSKENGKPVYRCMYCDTKVIE